LQKLGELTHGFFSADKLAQTAAAFVPRRKTPGKGIP
jgi:hypothetical protein